MANKIIILRGLQGSGKTSWARQWVMEDPTQRVRFNCDDIRNMLGKYWVPGREGLIEGIYLSFLEQATANGYDIVIDNMNLNDKYIKEIETFVAETNEWLSQSPSNYTYEIEVNDSFLDVPLETCIERDSLRDNPIGEKVIRDTFNKYKDRIPQWKNLN